MTELVDVARILLTLLAGVALGALARATWADYRADRRDCLQLQLALLVGLLVAAYDSLQRVGEPFNPVLFVGRLTVVVLVLVYDTRRWRVS